MIYTDELQFEHDLVEVLKTKGWEGGVLNHPTEDDLINNWKDILFQNNRNIDRLNNEPLTDTEMQQILEQITKLRTPLRLNGFINGTSVSIKRDNPNDKLHLGKEVSLKIYDRNEIAAGQSRYQIAEQPIFKTKSMLNDRRGDIMLLINGMPVIHIELKKSKIDVTQAVHQIEKYSYEGVFTGLFSLVQIFVAMNPEETIYFANPGCEGKFNNKFYFHWANFNNEPINDWKEIADKFLSIPMAHQLIGFYTVADDLDGVLKVMRSYQYFAAWKISDRVSKNDWNSLDSHGGYIWHTTGSGKTLTSFKSAELIANSKDADKVVFLLDRVELGDQSLREFKGFIDDDGEVAGTKNTFDLISKLKSDDSNKTLIVTSIQKMARIKDVSLNLDDIAEINKKRLVFIIDECHRDTFGDMLISIKETFPKALFFGFTGTPIFKENTVKGLTQSDVFGDELHRYSIADGIRDGNVLGFDPSMVKTYSDNSLREAVALEKAKAKDFSELTDESKKDIYYKYMNNVPMCGYENESGEYIKGIEDYIPDAQYDNDEHRNQVITNILENWDRISYGRTFSAILATSSIKEAIKYYRQFKLYDHNLNITGLFDPSLDNTGGAALKEDGLVEIIEDYDRMYNQSFTIPTYDKMKKDISLRLAHKKQYSMIDNKSEEKLDLLIVVDQMLTGYDSKYLNTLYLDKMLKYQNIIQAFSRTNRVFGKGKDFGIIKYYRKTNTMQSNVNKALKLYSGDKPFGLFVDKIDENLKHMNSKYEEIKDLFNSNGIYNFERLPDDKADKAKFVKLFQEFNKYLNAARVQGFKWDKDLYYVDDRGETTEEIEEVLYENMETREADLSSYNECIKTDCDETSYNALIQRYNEVQNNRGTKDDDDDIPYKIDPTIIEIDTGKIDADYMNSKFDKYLKSLHQTNINPEELEKSLNELHKSFASLSQQEQKYANILIHDIDSGNIELDSTKQFMDYIYEYANKEKNDEIKDFCSILGYDEVALRNLMSQVVTEKNIDDFGRFEKLSKTIDMNKAKEYFDKIKKKSLQPFEVYIKGQQLLRRFILENGFDISIKEKDMED